MAECRSSGWLRAQIEAGRQHVPDLVTALGFPMAVLRSFL
jgi:hypothetical protein